MRDGVVEPIRLPASFWQAADVREALTSRDISKLFREASRRGLSQTKIGIAVGISQGRISEIIRGARGVARLQVLAGVSGLP